MRTAISRLIQPGARTWVLPVVTVVAAFNASTITDGQTFSVSSLKPTAIQLADQPSSGIDLGIADDQMYRRPLAWSTHPPLHADADRTIRPFKDNEESRPGVFIAWRNTELVEEVEVRVRNLGDREGQAQVAVDIVDNVGNIELHLEPVSYNQTVLIPARGNGGLDGRIVKMKADRRLNRLIDLYDRTKKPYHVRATVRTLGAVDANLSDNVKVKSFNIPFRATPGSRQIFRYAFDSKIVGQRPVRWRIESTEIPGGWQLAGTPTNIGTFSLPVNTQNLGFLQVDIPASSKEGEMFELRLSLLDANTNEVVEQREWFLANDQTPPQISEIRVRTGETQQFKLDPGMVRVDLMAADMGSGILEASGVWLDISADEGRTFVQRTSQYNVGNFVAPTSFTADIGPYRAGTKLQIFVNALDSAGNVTRHGPEEVVVE